MGTRVIGGGCPSGLRTVILASSALEVPPNKGNAIRDAAIKNPLIFLFIDSSPSRAFDAAGSALYSSKIRLIHKISVKRHRFHGMH